MKRVKLITAAILSLAFLSSCVQQKAPITSATPSATPTAGEETVDITILGTSDIHGHFMPWDYASDTEYTDGAMTSIATLIKQVRAEEENVILVDCGDSIQDNFNELFKDSDKNPLVEGMNALGYDAWVMGNHEYNFRPEILNKWIDGFHGAALSGVVYYNEEAGDKAGQQYLPATTVVERAGVKIGLVGLTPPSIEANEATTGTLDTYDIHDALTEAEKAVQELEGKVDAIVGVIHMGATQVESILKEVPGFDAVICGHSHTTIDNELVEGVQVTQPGSWASDLSRVDLTMKRDGDDWKVENVDTSVTSAKDVPHDEELTALLTPYHDQLRTWVDEPIGHVEGDNNMVAPDDIKGIATVQTEPTAYFNLLHEVAQYYSGAMVVGFGTDCDTASLQGDIRIKDMAYNYTYPGGEITVYEMKGSDLKDYMEWSAAYFNQLKEGDITLSYDPARRGSYSTNTIFGGVNYKIDATREPGDRIVELNWPDGRPVDLDETVTLGIHSYRLQGQQKPGGWMEGRYFDVVYSSTEEYGDQGGTLRNLTITYVKDVLGGKVVPDETKNWEILGVDKDSDDYKLAKELINSGKLTLHDEEVGGRLLTNIAPITTEDLAPFKK